MVGVSGGKDSIATYLYLTRTLGLPRVTGLFANTGHEFPEAYEYLDLLEREHGFKIVRIQCTLGDVVGAKEIKAGKACERLGLLGDNGEPIPGWEDHPIDMKRLAILKRRFPSTMVRFCTTILKLLPRRRWLLENCGTLEDVISVSGVRAQESANRAKQLPYVWDDFINCPMWKPIFHWTHEEVFAIHEQFGVPPNPLYLQGMGRVGCAPCIGLNKAEAAQIALRRPETFVQLHAMEREVAETTGKPVISFFSNSKTPARFHSHICPNSGKTFPDAMDVMRWALGDDPRLVDHPLLFDADADGDEDIHACSSQYGLCE